MRQHLTIALIIVAGLGACASEAAEEAFTVTDSAGVSIAVSHAPLWPEGSGWRLGGQPSVLIGGGITDTSAIVGPIAGAMRLPDGRILVADAGATRLRWFADDGTMLQSVGRQGEGPGEFRTISALLHVGDSIAVLDSRLRRLSLLDLEGRFGRSITLMGHRRIGRLATGEWIGLVGEGHSTGESDRAVRDSVAVWIVSDAGERVRWLATLPGDDELVFASPDVVGSFRAPYGRTTTVRFNDGQLWVGTGDRHQLDRLGMNGAPESSVRWDRPRLPLDAAERSRIADSLQSEWRGLPPHVATEVRRALDSWTMPVYAPAYGRFMLDDPGNLWVAEYALDGSVAPIAWDVFNTQGRWLGDVALPPGFDPTHITADEVLGIWTDPDGLERVVAYPLIRSSN